MFWICTSFVNRCTQLTTSQSLVSDEKSTDDIRYYIPYDGGALALSVDNSLAVIVPVQVVNVCEGDEISCPLDHGCVMYFNSSQVSVCVSVLHSNIHR